MARWLLQPPPGASEGAFALAENLIAEAGAAATSAWSEHNEVGDEARSTRGYNLARLSAAASRLPAPLGRYSAPLRIGGTLGTLWRCEVSTVHTYLIFEAPGLAESILIDVTYKQFLVIPEWMDEHHFEAARSMDLFSHLPDAFVGTAAQLVAGAMYQATRRTADDVTERASMSPYDIHQKEKYEQREYLIAVEQIKMMQEKLKVCYLRSGPNHFEDCKELREKLWTKMNTHNYGAPGPARSSAKFGVSNPLGEGNVRPVAE